MVSQGIYLAKVLLERGEAGASSGIRITLLAQKLRQMIKVKGGGCIDVKGERFCVRKLDVRFSW